MDVRRFFWLEMGLSGKHPTPLKKVVSLKKNSVKRRIFVAAKPMATPIDKRN